MDTVLAASDVDATHTGRKHQALEGGQFCWDCHEAHGGSATNILMVKDYLSIAADAYGVPTTTTTTAVAFTARAVVTDFVDTTAPTEATAGICQKCHVNKATPDVKYWRFDGTEDANQDNTNDAGVNDTNRHNQALVCTTCHLHKDQFGASCTDCHGTVGVNYYPDSGVNGIVAPNRAGKHAAHVARIVAVMGGSYSAANGSTCAWCHPGGVHSGDEGVATPEPSELHTGVATDFLTINGLNDADGAGSAANCANVNCHYNNTVTIADWYGTPVVNCDYCHQTDGAYNALASPLPNAHTVHVDEVLDGGYDYACTVCHVSNGTDDAHQNGVVNLATVGLPYETDADATFTPSLTPTVKYGGAAATACNSVYCHGDFGGQVATQVGGGNAGNAPVWGTTDERRLRDVPRVGGGAGRGEQGVAAHGGVYAEPRGARGVEQRAWVLGVPRLGRERCGGGTGDVWGRGIARQRRGEPGVRRGEGRGGGNRVSGRSGGLQRHGGQRVGDGRGDVRERALPQRGDDAGVRSGGGG